MAVFGPLKSPTIISRKIWATDYVISKSERGPVILRTPGVRRRTPRTPDGPLFFLVIYGPHIIFWKLFSSCHDVVVKQLVCCCKIHGVRHNRVKYGPLIQFFLKYPLFVSPCTMTDYYTLVEFIGKHIFYQSQLWSVFDDYHIFFLTVIIQLCS